MPNPTTAEAKFTRLTSMIPRATRPDGVLLGELSSLYDLPASQLLRDIQELTARSYYLPAGSADDFGVAIDQDRISVRTTGEFQRPPRLSARESLALSLGLRILAAESEPDRRTELLELAERLSAELTASPAIGPTPHYGVEEVGRGAEIHTALQDAARDRRRCRIEYLKPGDPTPESREIEPYILIHAEGTWYTLAHCRERSGIRAFRLDRICGVHPGEESFEVPAEFDPADYLGDGRLYHSTESVEVMVRYSPAVARWIEEREGVSPGPDGSIVIRHNVSDPQWLVRYLLQYGREAEVLEPEEFRDLVRRRLALNLPRHQADLR